MSNPEHNPGWKVKPERSCFVVLCAVSVKPVSQSPCWSGHWKCFHYTFLSQKGSGEKRSEPIFFCNEKVRFMSDTLKTLQKEKRKRKHSSLRQWEWRFMSDCLSPWLTVRQSVSTVFAAVFLSLSTIVKPQRPRQETVMC